MVKIVIRDNAGAEAHIEASPATSSTLMEAIRHNSTMSLEAICGGMMSCSTCHVYIDPAWVEKVDPASEYEKELLNYLTHCQDNSRLSCQIPLTPTIDGLRATIAPSE